MVRPDVIDLPVGHDMNRLARGILEIGFDANCPADGIEYDAARGGIGSWVDYGFDFFAVPVHDYGKLRPLVGTRAPIAVPGTGERMSLLGQRQHSERHE